MQHHSSAESISGDLNTPDPRYSNFLCYLDRFGKYYTNPSVFFGNHSESILFPGMISVYTTFLFTVI